MPFEYRPYQSPYAGAIADLIGRRGDIAAQDALARGQVQASTVGNIAKGITGAVDQYQAQKAAQAKAELEARKVGIEEAKQRALDLKTATEARQKTATSQAIGQINAGMSFEEAQRIAQETGADAKEVLTFYNTVTSNAEARRKAKQEADNASNSAIATAFQAAKDMGWSPSAMQGILGAMDQHFGDDPKVNQLLEAVRGVQGQTPEQQAQSFGQMADEYLAVNQDIAAKMPKPTERPVDMTLPDGTVGKAILYSDGKYRDAQGNYVAGSQFAPEPKPKSDYEWVVRAGKPTEIVKGTAKIGDIPYHPPSEKSATVKDANGKPLATLEVRTIKEFDQGLGQIKELTQALNENKATGALASFEANWLPNVVTEVTGIGKEAKGRQAMIELAKQIVGKGLEGGVLRKEDELKYARMMPTMSDAPDVAAKKLGQLQTALERDRERYIDLLSETGRDVSRVTNPFGSETARTQNDKSNKSIKVGGFIVEQE